MTPSPPGGTRPGASERTESSDVGSLAAAAEEPSSAGRRAFTRTLVACLVGAGLTVLAVTRTWSVLLTRRPAPLPPLNVAQTGSSHVGWLVAVALVALAGTGALLATRGRIRTVLGALLVLVGAVIVGGGADGLRFADGARAVWPLLVIVGGVLVGYAGLRTAREGAGWPAMGAKYERAAQAAPSDRPVTDATMWDDLDRGVDPTSSP